MPMRVQHFKVLFSEVETVQCDSSHTKVETVQCDSSHTKVETVQCDSSHTKDQRHTYTRHSTGTSNCERFVLTKCRVSTDTFNNT